MQTLADIVEYMKENKKNPLTIDSWDSKPEGLYSLLKEMPHITIVDNYKVLIDHTPGGGCGMGEYPPHYTVSILLNFK